MSFFSQSWLVLNTEFAQFNCLLRHPPGQVKIVNGAELGSMGGASSLLPGALMSPAQGGYIGFLRPLRTC